MRTRRQILQFGTAAVVASIAPKAKAAGYPERTIRVVCPWPAGGVTDVLARALGQSMSSELGQPIVIDNKAGAGGMIGSAEVAKSAPDGYTLLFNTSSLVQAPLVSKEKLYDPVKDFTAIGSVGRTVMPFVVPASLAVSSLAEFVAHARGKKLPYGTYGHGTTSHAFQRLFSDYNQLDMVHVPYRGEAPMVVDLLAGQIPCGMGTMSTLVPHIKSGRLRGLAVLSGERVDSLRDVPTFIEQGYPSDFNWSGGFIGLFGPANLPEPVQTRLGEVFQNALGKPQLRESLANAYVSGRQTVLAAAAAEVTATYEAWAKLVARLNLANSD